MTHSPQLWFSNDCQTHVSTRVNIHTGCLQIAPTTAAYCISEASTPPNFRNSTVWVCSHWFRLFATTRFVEQLQSFSGSDMTKFLTKGLGIWNFRDVSSTDSTVSKLPVFLGWQGLRIDHPTITSGNRYFTKQKTISFSMRVLLPVSGFKFQVHEPSKADAIGFLSFTWAYCCFRPWEDLNFITFPMFEEKINTPEVRDYFESLRLAPGRILGLESFLPSFTFADMPMFMGDFLGRSMVFDGKLVGWSWLVCRS